MDAFAIDILLHLWRKQSTYNAQSPAYVMQLYDERPQSGGAILPLTHTAYPGPVAEPLSQALGVGDSMVLDHVEMRLTVDNTLCTQLTTHG